jgi:hypothetical protein
MTVGLVKRHALGNMLCLVGHFEFLNFSMADSRLWCVFGCVSLAMSLHLWFQEEESDLCWQAIMSTARKRTVLSASVRGYTIPVALTPVTMAEAGKREHLRSQNRRNPWPPAAHQRPLLLSTLFVSRVRTVEMVRTNLGISCPSPCTSQKKITQNCPRRFKLRDPPTPSMYLCILRVQTPHQRQPPTPDGQPHLESQFPQHHFALTPPR